MPIGKTYDSNNKKEFNVNVYSPIAFSNPESTICPSKLNVSYFNKLLNISISQKLPKKDGDSYVKYDNDNRAKVYISPTKARILYELMQDLKNDEKIHNVCIELKNGLLTVSDGAEFGVNSPCITIRSADESGNIASVVYETKTQFHRGAYNYNEADGTYEDVFMDKLEIDSLETVLEQYFLASTYAVASTVMNANSYFNNKLMEVAGKVGATNANGNKSYNSKTFLGNNNSAQQSINSNNNVPNEYTTSSFDDIAKAMH